MFDAIRHKVYIWAQWWQSRAKRTKDPGFRTRRYLSEIRDWMPGLWPWPEPVLCLGPRNAFELGHLRKAGMDFVIGLDLFSRHPDILVGDMHALKFQDNTFGMVWASHALEHSRQIETVLGEVARVLKPGGWLVAAWPTQFRPNWHDKDLGLPSDVVASLPGGQILMTHRYQAGASAEHLAVFRVVK